jgi:DNA-directed RNA polymerase beta' subunit
MSKEKRVVEVTRRNWDADFYADMQRGGHFIISEPAEYTVDGQRKNSLYGAQSPLYGTDFDSEQAFVERYRCKCGEIQGKAFEGFTCPVCKSKVTFKDTDIKIIGWVSYGKNRLINPYYYHKISSLMPKGVFNDIIYSKYKITTNGIREKANEHDFDTPPLSPYSGIGIDEFYVNFEEILDFFRKKNKNKASSVDIILKEKNKVFTSHWPVFTPKLRPSGSTSDTYYYNTLDKDINTIFTLSENLKSCIDVERDYIIQRIQQKMVHSWDLVFETLPKKSGLIRNEILGGSLNYSSRNVICPN